jgi:hypothetical protein
MRLFLFHLLLAVAVLGGGVAAILTLTADPVSPDRGLFSASAADPRPRCNGPAPPAGPRGACSCAAIEFCEGNRGCNGKWNGWECRRAWKLCACTKR